MSSQKRTIREICVSRRHLLEGPEAEEIRQSDKAVPSLTHGVGPVHNRAGDKKPRSDILGFGRRSGARQLDAAMSAFRDEAEDICSH